MTDTERVVIFKEALYKAGQMLRENPPQMDLLLENPEMLRIVCGGNARDPKGREWANYFVKKVVEERHNET
jgi:hypothetical protein